MKQKIKENQQTESNHAILEDLKRQEIELLATLDQNKDCKQHAKSLKLERDILAAKLERQETFLKDLEENLTIYKYALNTVVK